MASIASPFATGDSLIHRLDPRIRLLSAAALTLPTALLHRTNASLAALGFGIILILLTRLPLGKVAARVATVNVFILFLWLFIPFSLPGTPVFTWGPLAATHEGVEFALLITIKSNAIVLALLALLGTIGVQDLGPAMQQLKIPGKLCHILLFTYRYIFVIYQEYVTMRQAMRARGFKPKTNKHTYRSYAWLIGMLLVKSWDRAERVHNAMRCRGFRNQFYSLTEFSTSFKDYAFLVGCLLSSAVVICLEFTRYS